MKIVDGFIFYNELDMLEYRLSVLDDVVDYFVLVEATHTHAGKEKPLFFEENKNRYAKWADKIVHVVDRDFPYIFPNIDHSKDQQWRNENHQRSSIKTGLDRLCLEPDDVVLISDLDEIVDPTLLTKVRSGEVKITMQALGQVYHCYNLNTRTSTDWTLARILAYRNLTGSCQSVREQQCPVISRAGWHLTYFGNADFIRNKIISFAHQELNNDHYTDINYIQSKMKDSTDLYGREPWGVAYHNIHVAVEDNPYLPPNYQKYLSAFYTPKTVASP